jgi:hypothetical protein
VEHVLIGACLSNSCRSRTMRSILYFFHRSVVHGSLAIVCPPAEHCILTVDLFLSQLMYFGLLDFFKVIRSDVPDFPVYNWWCVFRVIQVCSFISSLD